MAKFIVRHLIFILTLHLLMIGCKQSPTFKLVDLKFADFEKEQIAINNIDTTFLISDNQVLNLGESDTFGYWTYDKNGNLLTERMRMFGGHSVKYEYDSNGFVNFKKYVTDFSAIFKSTYKFLSDSLLLYQFWTGNDSDTCIFKFDKSGKIIEAIEYRNDDHGRGEHFKTVYEYNPSGQLLKKTIVLLVSRENQNRYELEFGTGLSTKNITNYYYSVNKLDSTITTFYFPSQQNLNYNSKTFYYSNGLRNITVDRDTIITRYEHRKRTN
jgi:hypothetical protein